MFAGYGKSVQLYNSVLASAECGGAHIRLIDTSLSAVTKLSNFVNLWVGEFNSCKKCDI